MYIPMINLDRFDFVIVVIFNQGFEFLGWDSIYPNKLRENINEGEEIFSPIKRRSGHRSTNITMNQFKRETCLPG
jgi:hypothetical protein